MGRDCQALLPVLSASRPPAGGAVGRQTGPARRQVCPVRHSPHLPRTRLRNVAMPCVLIFVVIPSEAVSWPTRFCVPLDFTGRGTCSFGRSESRKQIPRTASRAPENRGDSRNARDSAPFACPQGRPFACPQGRPFACPQGRRDDSFTRVGRAAARIYAGHSMDSAPLTTSAAPLRKSS